MEINQEISSLVDSLRNRPQLFMQKVENFSSYLNFFDGYFVAIDRFLKIDISKNFSRFLNKIENDIELSNAPWILIFESKYLYQSEEFKIDKLLSLIKAFADSEYYFNYKI